MAAQSTYISTAEAARLLGLSTRHIGHLLRTGVLVGERIGRPWLVRRASLGRYRRDPSGRGRPVGGGKRRKSSSG